MTTKDNHARLQESIRNTLELVKEMERERLAKASAASKNNADDDFDALFAPREAPEGRISELCRNLREAEATMLRHDADDEGPESAVARETAKRILEEMSAVQPGSHLDALAAIHFVRWYLMKDLVGAEFGHEERAVVNQLDGLTQYLCDSMS